MESMTPPDGHEPADGTAPDERASAVEGTQPPSPAPPVGDPTGFGAVALFVAAAGGMAVATAVALVVVGIGPLLLGASLNSRSALFVSAWAALLLTVGAAVLGVRLCNRAKTRLLRIALYVGFGLAVLPIGFVNLLLAGSCIASGGDSVSFH